MKGSKCTIKNTLPHLCAERFSVQALAEKEMFSAVAVHNAPLHPRREVDVILGEWVGKTKALQAPTERRYESTNTVLKEQLRSGSTWRFSVRSME